MASSWKLPGAARWCSSAGLRCNLFLDLGWPARRAFMARSTNGNGVVSHVVLQATGWVFRALQNSLNKGHSLALVRQCSGYRTFAAVLFRLVALSLNVGRLFPYRQSPIHFVWISKTIPSAANTQSERYHIPSARQRPVHCIITANWRSSNSVKQCLWTLSNPHSRHTL